MRTLPFLAPLLFAAGVAAAAPAATTGEPGRTPRPNIVVILLDDVGFGQMGTFGGPVDTPALDRLAATGLKYNRFHTTALCSPTRASLLTGRNHHRTSFGTLADLANDEPGYRGVWKKSIATLPEILKRNGFSTAAFGKWHNTRRHEISPVGPFDAWPTGIGFEYFYGFMAGEVSQWEPPLYRNTLPVDPPKSAAAGYHITTDLVDEAIRWVGTQQAVAPDRPYFLYFAPGATHAPLHAPQDWIARYKGRFDQGWDALRAETLARQKKLGVVPAGTDLTPRPAQLPAWASLSADQKRLYARQAEVLAGFTAHTDHELGRLIEAIRGSPGGENTLIFYIAGDNGASAEGGLEGSDQNAATAYAGQKVTIAEQVASAAKLGGPELDNHMAAAWAWAMNSPFQWTKQTASHFGGTRNPLVVSWPARYRGKGALRTQFTHVNDLAPTIYEVLAITPPQLLDGIAQEPMDGASFAATFADPAAPATHRIQYFEQLGNLALYQDGWIASAFNAPAWEKERLDVYTDVQKVREPPTWELYHIDEDFSQAHDLAGRYPARLEAMRKLFDAEARRNDVYPVLDSLVAARARSLKSEPRDTRRSFTYPGDLPRMMATAVPLLLGSHSIRARIEVPASGATGVIVANGGRSGGYALRVDDGYLVYEQNFFGRQHSLVRASYRLPTGAVTVAFEFQQTGKQRWGGGIGRLFIGGEPAGEGPVSNVGMPWMFDTFDIGADRASPVGSDYQAPATFSGRVLEVTLELSAPRG